MHDGSAPEWRQTIDRHHAALVEDLTAQLDAEIESSIVRAVSDERKRNDDERKRIDDERARADAELATAVMEERTRASEAARRRLSESLNQTLRRIRQTSAEHETLQLLLEDSASCAERAVVVLIENNQARIAAWRAAALRGDDEDNAPIDLAEAAAIASCVESRDPLVALAAPGEISPILASALNGTDAATGKVYLFPITVRQNTLALLLASGEVVPAPLELLCEGVGMKLESLDAPVPLVPVAPAEKAPLVQIANAATTWTKLTPEEQALHLRAQRTAKVRVAQIRISESEALRKGTQAHDIYGALRPSIDAARAEYRQAYISQTPTMVDYLHLEMIRSLAHEDSRLLGEDYPGPIA